MSFRTLVASALHAAADRIAAIEHPDPRGVASLAKSAAQVRALAVMLDPPITTCIVCFEQLSLAQTETHACPPGALAAWHARELDAVDAELDS